MAPLEWRGGEGGCTHSEKEKVVWSYPVMADSSRQFFRDLISTLHVMYYQSIQTDGRMDVFHILHIFFSLDFKDIWDQFNLIQFNLI